MTQRQISPEQAVGGNLFTYMPRNVRADSLAKRLAEVMEGANAGAPAARDGAATPAAAGTAAPSVAAVESNRLAADSNTGTPIAPGLMKIALLGQLFLVGQGNATRTKLAVAINPYVINEGSVARHSTEEFKAMLQLLQPQFAPGNATLGAPDAHATAPALPQYSKTLSAASAPASASAAPPAAVHAIGCAAPPPASAPTGAPR